jgi:hypothetical protein
MGETPPGRFFTHPRLSLGRIHAMTTAKSKADDAEAMRKLSSVIAPSDSDHILHVFKQRWLQHPAYMVIYPPRLPPDEYGIPVGHVLAHGKVRPTSKRQRQGEGGFVFFYLAEVMVKKLGFMERCDCGWASQYGDHYRPVDDAKACRGTDLILVPVKEQEGSA